MVPADADALHRGRARATYGLEPEGLMCIPPAGEPPGPHFALLGKIAARNGLAKLSMGMSDDFETAIRFGATSVRVGSAVFGGAAALGADLHRVARQGLRQQLLKVRAGNGDAALGRRIVRWLRCRKIAEPMPGTTGSSLWPRTTTMS